MTTVSCGMLSSTIFADIVISTVCNWGEAFRKSSKDVALHSSAVVENNLNVVMFGNNLNVVMFGNRKWLKEESF